MNLDTYIKYMSSRRVSVCEEWCPQLIPRKTVTHRYALAMPGHSMYDFIQ